MMLRLPSLLELLALEDWVISPFSLPPRWVVTLQSLAAPTIRRTRQCSWGLLTLLPPRVLKSLIWVAESSIVFSLPPVRSQVCFPSSFSAADPPDWKLFIPIMAPGGTILLMGVS